MSEQALQQDTRSPAVHDGFSVASLILGILWVFGLGAILAVIFAHISMHQAKLANRRTSGLSIAGLILGYVGIAGLILFIILVVTAAATPSTCWNPQIGYYQC